MPSIDFEALDEDSKVLNKVKDRVSSNVKDIKVTATTAAISAKNNFKNNTTRKLKKSQIDKYSDASYFANTERSMKPYSNEKKLKKCKEEIETLNELIKDVKQELITAPKDISAKKKFTSDAVSAATGGIAGSTIDYNKDKWNQVLDGLEGNKKRFEKLKKELSKSVKESANLLDW